MSLRENIALTTLVSRFIKKTYLLRRVNNCLKFYFISGRPVTVYVDLYIVDIGEISVTNMVRLYVVGFIYYFYLTIKEYCKSENKSEKKYHNLAAWV